MSGESNLRPFSEISKEKRSEIAKKGGVASGEARRRKKTMQEKARAILDMTERLGKAESFKSIEDADGKNLTAEERSIIEIAKKAMAGDIKALEFLRDTAGEKPVEQVELLNEIEEAEREVSEIIARKRAESRE